MHQDRFFESTRGKIVTALRGRRGSSAFDLAAEFGLSPNAIRQQLVILERDGLVAGQRVRRGKTKPTVEYALTSEADRLFPQRYDKMLNAVLREVRASGGDDAVQAIFAGMGKRSAGRLKDAIDPAQPAPERARELTRVLRESGVDADVVSTTDGFAITEHSCPYAKTVSEHPEVCSVIHTIIAEVVSPEVKQTESLATGGRECRFEVT
jgi:predicted ArsR family transcriptional regulator